VADFVKETRAGLEDLLDHFVYIAELVGVEHIGLGSDFDGADDMIIDTVSGYQQLATDLIKRGFAPAEVEKIFSGNALTIINEVI
jgi:membrane dipeptidase